MFFTRRLLTVLVFCAGLIVFALPAAVFGEKQPPLPQQAEATPIPSSGTGSALGGNVPSLSATIAPLPGQSAVQPPLAAETTEEAAPVTNGASSPVLTTLDGQACPSGVQDAYTAASIACDALGSGEACIGNGVVKVATRTEIPNFSFALAGDKARFTDMSEINLTTLATDSKLWSIVRGQLVLNTTDTGASADSAMLIFGDVAIIDAGERSSAGGKSAIVLATSGMNVRRAPANDGVVVWQLAPGETVTATGRTQDQNWIRILIPGPFGGNGWVYAPFLDVEGGSETLPFVTENSPPPASLDGPEFGTMQAFNFLSGITNADCTDAPDSGILLQSPNGLPGTSFAKVRINGVAINLNGTVFIQAQESQALRVTVLEGQAVVSANAGSQTANAGTVVSVTMGATLDPIGTPTPGTLEEDTTKLGFLPIDLLPRPIVLPTPQALAGGGETGSLGGGAPVVVATDASTGIVLSAAQPTAAAVEPCVLTAVGEVKNLRAAPGTDFPISGNLQAGETINATAQTRDADGLPYIWYFTVRGYIRFDTVDATDSCTQLPLAQVDASSLATVAAPAATPTPAAPPPPSTSLNSSEYGEVCGQQPLTRSFVAENTGFTTQVGGTWTASANTKTRFAIEGGIIFRADYGDFMRLTDEADNIITRSGQAQTMEFTFTQATTFKFLVAVNRGNFVVFTIECLP